MNLVSKYKCFMKTLILLASVLSTQAFASVLDIREFSVFSKSDIRYARSDFEGRVGALGSVRVEDFSFYKAPVSGVYVGEKFEHLRGVNLSTPVEAGDSILMAYVKSQGEVKYSITSPDVGLFESSVKGVIRSSQLRVSYGANNYPSVSYGGYKKMSQNDSYSFGQNLKNDLLTTAIKLDELSLECASLPGALVNPENGILTLEGQSGRNVFMLEGSVLSSIERVQFLGPADASFVLNIRGEEIKIEHLGIILGNTSPARIIWNFYEAQKLEISRSGSGEILAGRAVGIPGVMMATVADVTFTEAVITGSLFVGSLQGDVPGLSGGQVNFSRHVGNWCVAGGKPGRGK